MRIHIISHVHLLVIAHSCVAKTLMLDVTYKLFNKILSHLPHFIPFLVTLALAGITWSTESFFFFYVRCDDHAKSSGRWLLGSPPSAVVRQLAPRAWCPLQCLLAKTGQQKAKPVDFIFSHTFHLIRMNFDVMLKQFKLNVLLILLSEINVVKGVNGCLYWLHQKLQDWHAFGHS